MRLGLVTCVFLAVAGMVTGVAIEGPFNRIDIKVPNPITIKSGEAADISVGPDVVKHVVDANLLTISEADTPNPTAAVTLTVPFANIIEVMGTGTGSVQGFLLAGMST